MVVGVTNETGNFFPAMLVLTTHEDPTAWEEIYGYIHSLNIHPSFRMADGAEALEKIFLEIVKIVRTHPGLCVGVIEPSHQN